MFQYTVQHSLIYNHMINIVPVSTRSRLLQEVCLRIIDSAMQLIL